MGTVARDQLLSSSLPLATGELLAAGNGLDKICLHIARVRAKFNGGITFA